MSDSFTVENYVDIYMYFNIIIEEIVINVWKAVWEMLIKYRYYNNYYYLLSFLHYLVRSYEPAYMLVNG